MASLPINVTLVGKDSTNPALPTYNLRGTLAIQHGNLMFYSDSFVHKIPLEHADRIQQSNEFESWGQEWRFLLCLLLSAPIIFFTAGVGFIPLIWALWWLYSPIEVQILIKAWDEEHGLNAITVFSLGNERKYRADAPQIIQEMWKSRGVYRKDDERRGQVIYRL